MQKIHATAFFCKGWILLGLLPALVGCVAAIPPSGFDPVAELPANTRIDNDTYHFDVTPVNSPLEQLPWRVYRHHNDSRNTVMKSGIPGQAHTISVLLRHENLHPSKLRLFAKTKYPDTRFLASKDTPNCIRSDPEKPMHFESKSYGYVAFCINPKTGEVYELTMQEKSVIAKPESPGLLRAMYTFFESFRFKPNSP